MEQRAAELRWGVEQRLAFIDDCLLWAGRVNRSDLIQRFGISTPQASSDISKYFDIAPQNGRYDRKNKCYVVDATFSPAFSKCKPSEALEQMKTQDATTPGYSPPWASGVVVESAVPRTGRGVNSFVVAALISAVRANKMVEVEYHSLNSLEPSKRRISPHAFVDDGDRWHVRAWSSEREQFRDFLVSRISHVSDLSKPGISPTMDKEWHSIVTLRLAPNPKLSDGAKRALIEEYRMANNVVEMDVRVCLAFYVENRLGLDLNDDAVPPNRKQLVLVNRDELELARANAKADTAAAISGLSI